MNIVDFQKQHEAQARELALKNYFEERACLKALPQLSNVPQMDAFIENGLGVAAFDGDDMLGFMCCYSPWKNAFYSGATGTIVPVHAHGAIRENRAMIYKRLYQAAAQKWIEKKISYHAISIYAHDSQTTDAFFSYGFGRRFLDAIRPAIPIECGECEGIAFEELDCAQADQVRELRRLLNVHLGKSPSFILLPKQLEEAWLARVEASGSRLFVARASERIAAFLQVDDDGENFITEISLMKNICGIYCLEDYRGKGVAQALLNYALLKLIDEGTQLIGVDCESFNPTASGFWGKYFTTYTTTLTRRIDEWCFEG